MAIMTARFPWTQEIWWLSAPLIPNLLGVGTGMSAISILILAFSCTALTAHSFTERLKCFSLISMAYLMSFPILKTAGDRKRTPGGGGGESRGGGGRNPPFFFCYYHQ